MTLPPTTVIGWDISWSGHGRKTPMMLDTPAWENGDLGVLMARTLERCARLGVREVLVHYPLGLTGAPLMDSTPFLEFRAHFRAWSRLDFQRWLVDMPQRAGVRPYYWTGVPQTRWEFRQQREFWGPLCARLGAPMLVYDHANASKKERRLASLGVQAGLACGVEGWNRSDGPDDAATVWGSTQRSEVQASGWSGIHHMRLINGDSTRLWRVGYDRPRRSMRLELSSGRRPVALLWNGGDAEVRHLKLSGYSVARGIWDRAWEEKA